MNSGVQLPKLEVYQVSVTPLDVISKATTLRIGNKYLVRYIYLSAYFAA